MVLVRFIRCDGLGGTVWSLDQLLCGLMGLFEFVCGFVMICLALFFPS